MHHEDVDLRLAPHPGSPAPLPSPLGRLDLAQTPRAERWPTWYGPCASVRRTSARWTHFLRILGPGATQRACAQGYAGSESSVQMYAVRWRKAHTRSATFLPLEFETGQDGQVDWGEAQVILDGVRALGLRLRDASVLFTPHICHGFPGKQAGSLLLRACARL